MKSSPFKSAPSISPRSAIVSCQKQALKQNKTNNTKTQPGGFQKDSSKTVKRSCLSHSFAQSEIAKHNFQKIWMECNPEEKFETGHCAGNVRVSGVCRHFF